MATKKCDSHKLFEHIYRGVANVTVLCQTVAVEAIIASLIGFSGLLIGLSIAWLRADIARQFDKIDERFDRIDERFDRIDERFDRLIDKMDERFARIDERFDEVLAVIAGQGERIARLEGRDLAATAAAAETAA